MVDVILGADDPPPPEPSPALPELFRIEHKLDTLRIDAAAHADLLGALLEAYGPLPAGTVELHRAHTGALVKALLVLKHRVRALRHELSQVLP